MLLSGGSTQPDVDHCSKGSCVMLVTLGGGGNCGGKILFKIFVPPNSDICMKN